MSTTSTDKTKKIKKGDRVIVNFNGAQSTLSHDAEVLYTPCATGDSWIFEDAESGDIHYVSEGCTVTKKRPNTSDCATDSRQG